MNARFDKRILFGFAALLPLLSACNPALQWRDPPQELHTKFVCSVRGLAKSCVRMTEMEFREVTRRLQPEV
jgi:hypothetical protein